MNICSAACFHYGTYRVSTSVGILGTSRLLLSLLVSFRIRTGHRIPLAALHAHSSSDVCNSRRYSAAPLTYFGIKLLTKGIAPVHTRTHPAPNLKFSSVDHRWVSLRLASSYSLRLRLNLADSISVVIFNRVSARRFRYPIRPRIVLRPKSQGPGPFPRSARFLLPCFTQAVNSHSLSNCPCKFPPSVTSIGSPSNLCG